MSLKCHSSVTSGKLVVLLSGLGFNFKCNSSVTRVPLTGSVCFIMVWEPF